MYMSLYFPPQRLIVILWLFYVSGSIIQAYIFCASYNKVRTNPKCDNTARIVSINDYLEGCVFCGFHKRFSQGV